MSDYRECDSRYDCDESRQRATELENLLRELCNVPAVQQALGTNHTPGCDCVYCRARSIF